MTYRVSSDPLDPPLSNAGQYEMEQSRTGMPQVYKPSKVAASSLEITPAVQAGPDSLSPWSARRKLLKLSHSLGSVP